MNAQRESRENWAPAQNGRMLILYLFQIEAAETALGGDPPDKSPSSGKIKHAIHWTVIYSVVEEPGSAGLFFSKKK